MDAAAKVLERIDSWAGEMRAVSQEIHDNPELALEEHQAMGWLADFCEGHGLATERGAYELPTAFKAEGGSGSGPTVIFCSEYDALPGIGHACGHNLIGVASAAAGAALAEVAGPLGGHSIVLGTPAEEAHGGKVILIERGAFEGATVSMMVHPATLDAEWSPTIAIVETEVVYTGKAAHASVMPWEGVNALDAMVTAYQAVGQLRQHIRPTERIHGIITDGGKAPNIVPDRAAARFYVRSATEASLDKLRARVRGCFEAGAEATGAAVDVSWEAVYTEVIPNGPLALAYRRSAEAVGRQLVDPAALPRWAAGSTDMGNVSHHLPAIHPIIKVAPTGVPPHSPQFTDYTDTDDAYQAMVDSAKAMALTALEVLTDEPLRRDIAEWYAAGRKPWDEGLER